MQKIQDTIKAIIHELYQIDFTPEISPAPKPELGEYCVNIFPIVKIAGKAPNIISEEVTKKLAENTEIFRSTSATGGYVNFFLTDSVWMSLFANLEEQTSKPANQQTIIVDYIGANAGKPLHIGHICTPSIGQVVCNIYRHLGYRVIGDSHFGDWGGIFGKLITMNRIITAELNPTLFESKEQQENYKIIAKYLVEETRKMDIEKMDIEKLKKTMGYAQYLDSAWRAVEAKEKYDFVKMMFFSYQLITIYIEFSKGIDEKCREEFKLLTEGNQKNISIWKWIVGDTVGALGNQLNSLNIGWKNKESEPSKFYNIGESFYEGLSLPRPNDEKYPDLQYTMKDIVAELITKGIATQNDDGSVGVVFLEDTKMPSCILQKKDGTGLYLTSDLAAIKYRLTNEWNPSKIIYCVDVRQQLHLKQAFAIAKRAWGKELGADNIEFFHAFNGFIKLKEGAMSTRHGTVIFLEALIEEGNERTEKILEEKGRTGDKKLSPENIQAITIGAIKYSYLTQDREKDVVFDWDKALNFEGHSGPYIQYAYVRARKISDASDIRHISDRKYPAGEEQDFSQARHDKNFEIGNLKFELSQSDKSLIRSLARFSVTVDTVAKTYKPHHLALYAYDIAVEFNSFYVHTPKILEEQDAELKAFRLALVAKTAETLKKSFELLAIEMPSEM